MKKIKIVVCMLQIITGGIEKSLIQILKEMKNYPQFEFSVIVKTDKIEQSYIDVLQSIEVPLKKLPFTNESDRYKHGYIISKIIKYSHKFRNKRWLMNELKSADLIIDYFNCSFIKELKNLNVRKIGWYHSSYDIYKNEFATMNVAKIYNQFICCTKLFSERAKRQDHNLSTIMYSYNPFDIQEIQRLALLDEKPIDGKYFIFVGRLHQDKDHLTVIKAFVKIANKYPDVRMYFLGDGEKRSEYEKIVHKNGLDKRIIFMGTIKNPFPYIKNALANILSSPNEGFGNVLVEAACLKTLNIASNCPDGPAEILLNGEAGILFPIGDSDSLAKIMENVIQGKNDKSAMVLTGYQAVGRFETKNVVKRIIKILENKMK